MTTLTQLEYIVAVARLRHFGKAAEQCHISQPTLSMQIQKVEEEIGYPLFDRLKKPVVPTPKGLKFIEQAQVLLIEHQKLMDISKQEGDELQGELRIGVIPTIAPYLVPRFLGEFAAENPAVQLRINEMKTSDIVKALREDQIDAGILAVPLHESGLRERPLYYEPFYIYISKSHPLHSRRRVRVSELDGSQMWLLEDGHCFRNQVVRFCSIDEASGVYPNVHFEGGQLDTLRHIIRQSSGYTLVPALFVESLDSKEIKDYVREIESPIPSREVGLIYRRDQWKSDMISALIESIRSNVPKAMLTPNPKKYEVMEVK